MINKCFIDTETTGLDSNVHCVHQVAAIITDEEGNRLDTINLCFRPKLFNFAGEALEKCRLNVKDVQERELSHKEAYDIFIGIIENHINRFNTKDKLQFIAYNSEFDEKFIRKWFIENNNDFFGSYFWAPSICMQKVSAWYLQEVRNQLTSFKLYRVCEFLGIKFNENEAHDAMYDVEKTLELYQKLNS